MPSRREFLTTVAVGAGAAAIAPALARAAEAREIKSPLNGPVGLQLWSVREYLPKDLPGTLAKVRAMGFRDVEGAGLWKHTVGELRSALDTAGLRCTSAHVGLDRLRSDLGGAFAEVKAMGASSLVCPWIPHTGDAFTREDALKAAADFNRIAKAGSDAGLRFGYHCHGYEFVPSTEGTLFDTLAQNSDPKLVGFQIDVFHALNGGADPVALITKHDGRIRSLHIKDMRKGFTPHQGSAGAPPDADVPIGTGQVDWPAVLRAAMKSGATEYYIEDESTDPWGHIPQSVAYLEGLKL